jgi:hypothetical protein
MIEHKNVANSGTTMEMTKTLLMRPCKITHRSDVTCFGRMKFASLKLKMLVVSEILIFSFRKTSEKPFFELKGKKNVFLIQS